MSREHNRRDHRRLTQEIRKKAGQRINTILRGFFCLFGALFSFILGVIGKKLLIGFVLGLCLALFGSYCLYKAYKIIPKEIKALSESVH